MTQTTFKKVSLSTEALRILESKRVSPEESYSDIVLRAVREQETPSKRSKIRVSGAPLRSLIREGTEEAAELGAACYEGEHW